MGSACSGCVVPELRVRHPYDDRRTRYETGSTRERQHDSAVLRATLPFEDYEIGYVHTDIAELRYESGNGPCVSLWTAPRSSCSPTSAIADLQAWGLI